MFVSLDDERVIRNLLTQQELEGEYDSQPSICTQNNKYVTALIHYNQRSNLL